MKNTSGDVCKHVKAALEYSDKRDSGFSYALNHITKTYRVKKALYPGSYFHITPSIYVPETVYVDTCKSSQLPFKGFSLDEYVREHKKYGESPVIRFHFKDYWSDFGENPASFDLLISMSAGFVSVACGKYLKKGGLLLADNEHNDAARAYVSAEYDFLGAFVVSNPQKACKGAGNQGAISVKYVTENIDQFFQTTKNQFLTLKMAEEILTRAPSKMSYRLRRKARLYLFEKM